MTDQLTPEEASAQSSKFAARPQDTAARRMKLVRVLLRRRDAEGRRVLSVVDGVARLVWIDKQAHPELYVDDDLPGSPEGASSAPGSGMSGS
jgi:hypothetical protein